MQSVFLSVLLCSMALVGETHAQEVIVARETKPEAPKQAAPPPEERAPESPTPAKPKSHIRKSRSSGPTLEEMRRAGASAAEQLNNPSPSQGNRSDSETAPAPRPVEPEVARPAKTETRPEQTSKRAPVTRTGSRETIGAVRPTMIESGRQQPSPTPSQKGQVPMP